MNNRLALESLSMDLKRVAIGYNRGSTKMADRFLGEAIKRKSEVDIKMTAPYINILLKRVDSFTQNNNIQSVSEEALMISTLLQNYLASFSQVHKSK